MTGNGSAYKSFLLHTTLANHGIRHKRTWPYTLQTNGKAGALSRRACTNGFTPDPTSPRRRTAVTLGLCDDDSRWPPSALGGQSPTSRTPKDNFFGNESQLILPISPIRSRPSRSFRICAGTSALRRVRAAHAALRRTETQDELSSGTTHAGSYEHAKNRTRHFPISKVFI